MEVGRTTAVLEGRFDNDAFTRFDRAVDQAKAKTRAPIDAKLTAETDATGFNEFGDQADKAERKSRNPIRRLLGADVEKRGFTEYDQRSDQVERKSRNPLRRLFGVDVEKRGFTEYENAADSAGDGAAGGILAKMKGIAAPLAVAGAAAGAALSKGISSAIDMEAARDRLAGQLNLTEEQSRIAGKVAGRVYTSAYGESLEQVNEAVRTLVQNVNVGVEDADLQPLAEKLLSISNTFEVESSEITRAIGTLIKNGLADNVDEAFDMIAAGFQGGMNRSDEFLESLTEYSAPLAALGISMEDFLSMTERGLDAGVYSVDKMGDALKELSIRAIDGSDATLEGFKQIGLSADDYSKAISEGGPAARAATAEIVDALMGVEDKRIQSQAGFALFGAMFEDLKADGIGALKPIDDGLQDVTGRADDLNKTLGDNNATVIEGFKRRVELGLASAGAAVIRLGGRIKEGLNFEGTAERLQPVVEWVGRAADGVKGFFAEARSANAGNLSKIFRNLRGLAGTVVDGMRRVGRAIKDAFSGDAGSSTVRDLQKIVKAVMSVTAVFTGLLKSVAGRAIPGIVTAVRGLAQTVRGVVQVITGILTLDFSKAWDGVKNIFGGSVEVLLGLLRAASAPFREGASRMFGGMKGVASAAWSGVTGVVRKSLDVILGGVSTAQGAIAKALDAASKLPFVGGKFKDLAAGVREAQRRIDDYRESLRDSNKEQDRGATRTEALRNRVSALRERLTGLRRGTSQYRTTAAELRRTQSTLNTELGEADGKARKGARGVRAIGKATENAATAVHDSGRTIGQNVSEMAKSLGLKPIKFSFSPTKKNPIFGDDPPKYATGGIPNPGSGGADDHLLVDPSGRPVAAMSGTEGILNTPQMGIVDHALQVAKAVGALPFGGLGELWGAGMRHFAGGGQLAGVPRFAGGGIVPVPGFPGERAASSVIPMILSIARRFGLTLTDAFGPGHKSPGHTVTGTAADFAGADSAMDRAVRYLVGRGYVVGYDGRYGSADWPGHGPAAGQGGSNAHLHVELAGKGKAITGGGRGVDVGQVTAPTIKGPAGALRTVARGAAKKMASSANEWLDSQSATLTAPVAGGGGARGGLTSAGGAWTKSRLAQLWRATNPGNGDPNLMAAIALAESSGNPRVVGIPTSGGRARGLWQIMWPLHAPKFPGMDPFVPRDNARMAGSILRSQGIGAWEAYTRGMHRKFMNVGGRLTNGLQRFNGGGQLGKGKKKTTFKESTLAGAGLSSSRFSSLRGMQRDRIGRFDRLSELVETDERRYGQQERRNDLTAEEYIDDDGNVNKADVSRRVAEINKLEAIKRRMIKRMEQAKKTAKRVQATYKTIVKRLRAALKAATKKTKGGKTSKARKQAARSYRAQIKDYTERIGEWRGKERELGFDLEDQRIDLSALQGEEKAVRGTRAEVRDPEPIEPFDDDVAIDTGGGGDGGGGDAPVDPPTDAVAAEPAAPTAEQVAEGVLSALNSYQAANADLYSSFGSNFMVGPGGDPLTGFGAAGVRYYGGGASGTDGGALEGAGGRRAATEAATGGITQNLYFTGPQPPDPLALTAAALHELQALA